MIEEGEEARHQPSQHHRMGMGWHLRVILREAHIKPQKHAANGIDKCKDKEITCRARHEFLIFKMRLERDDLAEIRFAQQALTPEFRLNLFDLKS